MEHGHIARSRDAFPPAIAMSANLLIDEHLLPLLIPAVWSWPPLSACCASPICYPDYFTVRQVLPPSGALLLVNSKLVNHFEENVESHGTDLSLVAQE